MAKPGKTGIPGHAKPFSGHAGPKTKAGGNVLTDGCVDCGGPAESPGVWRTGKKRIMGGGAETMDGSWAERGEITGFGGAVFRQAEKKWARDNHVSPGGNSIRLG